MKWYLKILLISLFIIVLATPSGVYAQSISPKGKKTVEPREELKDVKINKNLKNKTAKIIGAIVTNINRTTLIVNKDGSTYTITTSADTKYRRRYWGKSELSEISHDDTVNIWGTWTDDAKTTINAKFIRNMSIMKRYGVFIGAIKSKDTSSFILQSAYRGEQTVIVNPSTKFVNRKDKTISFNDLNIGDKVRVKGLWDKTLNKITEVTQVKNFSLPSKVTPTPKP